VTWNPGQSQKWGPHLTSKAIYLYGFWSIYITIDILVNNFFKSDFLSFIKTKFILCNRDDLQSFTMQTNIDELYWIPSSLLTYLLYIYIYIF
jgi:hypothetical protein